MLLQGYFLRKNCPQGNKCNYLHVFKNPNNEFSINNFSFVRNRQINAKTSKLDLQTNANAQNNKNNAWSSDDDDAVHYAHTANENMLKRDTPKSRKESEHSKERSAKRKSTNLNDSYKEKEDKRHNSRDKRSKHRSKSPTPQSNHHYRRHQFK